MSREIGVREPNLREAQNSHVRLNVLKDSRREEEYQTRDQSNENCSRGQMRGFRAVCGRIANIKDSLLERSGFELGVPLNSQSDGSFQSKFLRHPDERRRLKTG